MNSQSNVIKILVEISRVIVGATFVFSGFVKAVDPLGFTYKMQDYLINFNLTELFPLALPAAIFFVVAEFALGMLLFLGVYRKWTTILVGVMMAFFTPLTLWIALKNPVADCGCFGDALIISNWQTFYKNIVLSVGTILLIMKWRWITPLFSLKTAPLVAVFTVAFGIVFAVYNVYKLPVFDFRPYKIGANIPDNMFVDPAEADVLESVLIYSKDGIEKEFTEDNFPWDDSTWVFVDMKTRVVKEGVKPKIEDFNIESVYFDESANLWHTGGDITDLLLSDPGYTFWMVAYSLQDMNEKHLTRFKNAQNYARQHNYPFYCLTSSSLEEVEMWEKQHNTDFQFTHADERILKTIIRSNPGLLLVKEGTVINKWDDSRVPAFGEAPLNESNHANPPESKTRTATSLLLIVFLFFIPLGLIAWYDKK